jgi:hypothetical protein
MIHNPAQFTLLGPNSTKKLLNPDLTWTGHLPDGPHIAQAGDQTKYEEFGYTDVKPSRPDPTQSTLLGTISAPKLLNPDLTWTGHLPDEPHIAQAGDHTKHEFGYASGKPGWLLLDGNNLVNCGHV